MASERKVQEIVGAAVQGGAALVITMAVQRAANFILNQALLHFVDPAAYGMASIPLDLLLNTSLFLSREGFRLALGRVVLSGVPSDSPEFRRFVNLSWVPIVLGFITSFVSLQFLSSDDAEMRRAGLLFAIAAVLECLSEPAYLITQGCLVTSLRALAEGLGVLARTLVTFVLLVFVLPPKHSVLAFGLAQIALSLTLIAVYWGYILRCARMRTSCPINLKSLRHAFPAPVETEAKKSLSDVSAWLDPSQLSLSLALTAQSFFKHLLTQGDKIVLSLASSHYDQGLYALAQNYGSLAARIFFQPLEESGRLMFARLAAPVHGPTSERQLQKQRKGDERSQEADAAAAIRVRQTGDDDAGTAARKQEGLGVSGTPEAEAAGQEDRDATLSMLLSALVKLVTLVGLVFACFGANYTRVLLRIILPGKGWEEGDQAARVLSWYCLYVLVLALNGMTEAFVYALAGQDEVMSLSLIAGVSFIAFASLSMPLMRHLGTAGLVLANTMGMIIRIAYSVNYIQRRLRGKNSPSLSPHPYVIAAFIAAFAVTYMSDQRTDVSNLISVVKHVGLGVVCFVAVVGVVYVCERPFLRSLSDIRRLARGGGGTLEHPKHE